MPITSKATDVAIYNDVDPEVANIKAKTDNLPTDPADESLIEAAITAAAASGSAVPTVDLATNLLTSQVVGNKSDTTAGTSLVAVSKQIYARQGAPAGVSQSADIAAVKVDTAAIKLETDQIGTVTNTGGTATLGAVIGDVANSTLVARIGVGAAQEASLSGSTAAVNRVAGKTQIFNKVVTSAANAGDVTLATITTQGCLLKSITVESQGATTADLTAIAVLGGTGKVITFVDAAVTGLRANIAATDQQVAWTGAVTLDTTRTVVMTLTGTGATAVALNVTFEYEAVANGGYLA